MNTHNARKVVGSIAIAVACAATLGSCGRSADAAVCSATNQAIDQEIAAFALNDVEGKVVDTSAIQQGARESQNLSHLMTINANLSVLAQNGCPPRAGPIKPSNYIASAGDCYKATLTLTSAGYGGDEKEKAAAAAKMTAACEFSRWKEDEAGAR